MALAPALVLALDGATFDVIHPMVESGRLPNLARALREGQAVPLPSVTPPVTFPAWSSFMTGLQPGHHGIFDFTQKIEGAYRIRFVNASDRVGRSLFARVSDAGGRVLVLGMPAAFPPEDVRGLLVCGFDAPVSTGTDARSASDPALYERIAARVGPWMRPDLDERARADDFHERAVETLLARVDRKTAFALEALGALREQSRASRASAGPGGSTPELMMVVFSESDTVGHHHWRDHDPGSPRHDPSASAARKGAVRAVYERLDQACGTLREAFGDDAPCFVVSDHGMGGAARRIVHLDRHLADQGLLTRTRAGRPGGGLDGLARRARDGALRVLPAALAQQIFRRARAAAARLESAARFGGNDWSCTVAWSEEANTQPGVWINLRGREARGSVAPEDYERVRDDVIAALEDWRIPADGAAAGHAGSSRVVARARRREEIYDGPFVHRAPDIAIELADEAGYGLSLVPTPWAEGPPALRTLAAAEYGGGRGRGMNGTHRRDGIWIDARRSLSFTPANLAGAPLAIAQAMGLEWNADGQATDRGAEPRTRRDYTREEDELVARRLRALGYLE